MKEEAIVEETTARTEITYVTQEVHKVEEMEEKIEE